MSLFGGPWACELYPELDIVLTGSLWTSDMEWWSARDFCLTQQRRQKRSAAMGCLDRQEEVVAGHANIRALRYQFPNAFLADRLELPVV